MKEERTRLVVIGSDIQVLLHLKKQIPHRRNIEWHNNVFKKLNRFGIELVWNICVTIFFYLWLLDCVPDVSKKEQDNQSLLHVSKNFSARIKCCVSPKLTSVCPWLDTPYCAVSLVYWDNYGFSECYISPQQKRMTFHHIVYNTKLLWHQVCKESYTKTVDFH